MKFLSPRKNAGMVNTKFKHIILRIYRHPPPTSGSVFLSMDCDALLDHEINVVGVLTSLEAQERKGGREDEGRRGEKEGSRKRGNGKYYFPALLFSCGHVGALTHAYSSAKPKYKM